jgi:hypothetical protein
MTILCGEQRVVLTGEQLVFGDVKCTLHIGTAGPGAVSAAELVVDANAQVLQHVGDSRVLTARSSHSQTAITGCRSVCTSFAAPWTVCRAAAARHDRRGGTTSCAGQGAISGISGPCQAVGYCMPAGWRSSWSATSCSPGSRKPAGPCSSHSSGSHCRHAGTCLRKPRVLPCRGSGMPCARLLVRPRVCFCSD